jgi:hypothetical protein
MKEGNLSSKSAHHIQQCAKDIRDLEVKMALEKLAERGKPRNI